MKRKKRADRLARIYAHQSSGTVLVTQPGASQPVPVAVATVGVGSAIRGTVAATVTASVGGKIVRLDITTVAPVEVNSDARQRDCECDIARCPGRPGMEWGRPHDGMPASLFRSHAREEMAAAWRR